MHREICVRGEKVRTKFRDQAQLHGGRSEGLEHLDYAAGLPPFLRGPYSTMYLRQPWTIRQYAGFSTAEESNAFYRRNLAGGQTGLSVAFDLATHRGYDSDHPRVAGDVGMAGVAIDSVEDMKVLFDGIPLDRMSVSMTMNGAVLPVMAFYIVAAEEQGVDAGAARRHHPERRPQGVHGPQHLHLPAGAVDADRRPTSSAFCAAEMPHFNPISVSGYHMQEAGAPADIELAYTLADGLEYVRAGLAAGLTSTLRAASQLFLGHRHVPLHGDRQAACRARAVGAADASVQPASPKSMMLRTHCADVGLESDRTGRRSTTSRARRIEALAAVLGHTQSLHTNALDEAIALPSDFSARIARNTQLFLQQETRYHACGRSAGPAATTSSA